MCLLDADELIKWAFEPCFDRETQDFLMSELHATGSCFYRRIERSDFADSRREGSREVIEKKGKDLRAAIDRHGELYSTKVAGQN
jgi:hypothetical protein